MTWVIAISLALAAFAAGALIFRLPRATWSVFLAALALGLTGYALQASPGLSGAPRSAADEEFVDEWGLVDMRKTLVPERMRSGNEAVLMSDAFARRGRFVDAANFLSEAVKEDPDDFEAWLALGNALTEQADGVLTQASVYAYSRAAGLRPEHPSSGYFLGLALIRQGRMMEARPVWRSAVDSAPEGDEAAALVAQQLERLDEMLGRAGGAMPPAQPTDSAEVE